MNQPTKKYSRSAGKERVWLERCSRKRLGSIEEFCPTVIAPIIPVDCRNAAGRLELLQIKTRNKRSIDLVTMGYSYQECTIY